MITIPQLVAQALGSFLGAETRSRFGASHATLAEFLPSAARLTLECIGSSDALYHDIEHTMLVTLVGYDILVGRALQRATTAEDYANFILACLMHDIGYVRGVVHGDGDGYFVADATGRTVQLPTGASDAALAPYHVDRSKLFVIERLDGTEGVDATRIARAIEYTRFPYGPPETSAQDDLQDEEELLLRAADLIGQLGDPNYMRKANALFYEFEEIGLNKSLGYQTPADIIYKYPQFYWTHVAPQVQLAIRYLNVTSSGRQWIANLFSNVFRAERELSLSGPQLSSPS
ncbi:MAG TPA: metal-dependent phosphohydrolase [Bradyrhizobium sp.]|nr:metal-dependent phosphohydrolase [Bradyrhizobium sp.]